MPTEHPGLGDPSMETPFYVTPGCVEWTVQTDWNNMYVYDLFSFEEWLVGQAISFCTCFQTVIIPKSFQK